MDILREEYTSRYDYNREIAELKYRVRGVQIEMFHEKTEFLREKRKTADDAREVAKEVAYARHLMRYQGGITNVPWIDNYEQTCVDDKERDERNDAMFRRNTASLEQEKQELQAEMEALLKEAIIRFPYASEVKKKHTFRYINKKENNRLARLAEQERRDGAHISSLTQSSDPVGAVFCAAGVANDRAPRKEDLEQHRRLANAGVDLSQQLSIAKHLENNFDWLVVDFFVEIMKSRQDATDLRVSTFVEVLVDRIKSIFVILGKAKFNTRCNMTLSDIESFNNIDKLNVPYQILLRLTRSIKKDFSWEKLEELARFYAGNAELIDEFFTDPDKSIGKALETIKASEVVQ
ncbi:MAG: hypothetical protein LBE09_07930 [Christensenellaceae bacterium]|jgi:hypothetical protein|nr:hypothetical protein [Christensenellaceae bacterium]